MLSSNDAQTIIRTARKAHGCDCHWFPHQHPGTTPERGGYCPNVIQPGERYPEYMGESPGYQSGHRFCADCRKDQLGDWITE